jgi:endonuclease/exonuclease/phosphatase family metal-dependent hydrolase
MLFCGLVLPLRHLRPIALLVAAAALLVLPAGAAQAKAKPKKPNVRVMTRNLFLGADLGPGTRASSLQELVTAAGVILKQVDDNNFPTRAKGLAAEINAQQPDLVGLQEVALWRTEPCTESPLPPHATTVRYDFLKSLLDQLNKGKRRYTTVIAQPEFDFEVWANTDGNESTSGPGCPLGSEINGRLTMRDVILRRVGKPMTVTNVKAEHFKNLLQVKPGGVAVNVTRGWTRADVKLKGVPKFRFVNTHLEAFDNQPTNHVNNNTDVGNGQIRELQAKELFAAGGPAASKRTILVGDLNSDVKTEVKPGDGLAYRALLAGGFKERSTSKPLGCCLQGDLLTVNGGGKLSDFNHQVDHVMTNLPAKVKLLTSAVTGRKPVNGFWDSDHAGLFSGLLLS